MHAKVDQRITINLMDAIKSCIRKIRGKNMALKKLNQFNYFDAEGFFEKLKLITIGISVWREYGTNIEKGTKLEVVVAGDKHSYNNSDGEKVNNIYEKIMVKIPKKIDVPMNVEVKLINPEASIYGEYRNQLSVIAEDVQVVSK